MDPLLLDIPETLTTERLVLRVPRPGDGALVWPSVERSLTELKVWMPWATDDYDVSAAEAWCRRACGELHTRRQIQYLIFDHDTQHIGNVGAFAFDWDVPKGEIGYWLRTDHTGRGLMSEAVRRVTTMLLEELHFNRVEIRCDDRNARSARVAELAGFRLEGVLRNECLTPDGSLRDTRIYARLPNDCR